MHKIAAFCILGLVPPVSAIVVQDYTLAEAPPVGLDWDYVYNYKGSSAVAVGGGWLLTAGHVADDGGSGSLSIGTNVYQQQEIVYHPDADLALVRYDQALPGYYDLYTGILFDTPRLEVLMVGFGTTGSVAAAYFTDSGTGKGTKRWGSQIIDRTFIKKYDSNGTVGYTENFGFEMGFNTNSTIHEAGGGVGDSGSGVFYNDGGVWKLAGINTSRSGGPQYTDTFAISMPRYADWITDTIPEPAAMGLMGFATVGLFLSRAKRRRKLVGRSLFPIRGDEHTCDLFCAMEEGEDVEERVYADYMARMLEMIHASPLPAWMNMLHTRYNALNKALWHFIIATVERSAERKEAAGERVNIVVVKHLDIFLERISWGRIVMAVKSGRTKAWRVLRMRTLKSLDEFLEKMIK